MADNYRLSHQAPGPEDDGTTIRFDQVGSNIDEVFPSDVLKYPQNYGLQHSTTADQLNLAHGNADAEVRIYRAVPEGTTTINPGDWVAVSKEYAEAEARLEGSTVISAIAHAKDLWSEGLLEEWGFSGLLPLQAGSVVNVRDRTKENFPTGKFDRLATPGINEPTLGVAVKNHRQRTEMERGN